MPSIEIIVFNSRQLPTMFYGGMLPHEIDNNFFYFQKNEKLQLYVSVTLLSNAVLTIFRFQ
jgi:hypothetical protein